MLKLYPVIIMETWKNETSHCSKATSCNIRSNLLEDTNSRQDRQGDDGNIHTMREGSRKLLQKKAPPPRNLDQATSVERALPPPALPFLPPLLPCLAMLDQREGLWYTTIPLNDMSNGPPRLHMLFAHICPPRQKLFIILFLKKVPLTPHAPPKRTVFFSCIFS